MLTTSGTFLSLLQTESALAANLTARVVDAATQRPIPSRVYIQSEAGQWFFPESASAKGSAVRYEKRNWVNTNAVEYRTTLSADPFRMDLPPGAYTLTVERGKEYRALVQRVEVGWPVASHPLGSRTARARSRRSSCTLWT